MTAKTAMPCFGPSFGYQASPGSRQPPWRHGALGLVLLWLGLTASAQSPQSDPPSRVARLGAQQGTVVFAPAGDARWYRAIPNRPLSSGDRLWADRNTRAELHVGSTALRLDEQSLLVLSELNDQVLRITLQRGSLQVRVRDDMAGERIELDTGNLALVIERAGEYQIDTDPAADLTQVTVLSGSAVVYGDAGAARSLGSREQLAVSGRNLAAISAGQMTGSDFARWVDARNRIEDQSVSARYVSREVVGYQQLDAYGDWQNDAGYGAVWYPRNVDANWAPYREGSWVNVAPWGLTWIDSAPWGFAPSHYGRWARFGSRWGWVPGHQNARPVYAPALVTFIGGAPRVGSNGINSRNGNAGGSGGPGGLPLGDGRPGVGWFPLAPGEAWRPDYRASQRYIDRANRMAGSGQPLAPRLLGHANQRQPDAVTVVSSEAFGRDPIGRRDTIRLPEPALIGARAVPTPILPPHFAPDIGHAPSGFARRSGAPPSTASAQPDPAPAFPQRPPFSQDGMPRRDDYDQRGPGGMRGMQVVQQQQQMQAQEARDGQQRAAQQQQQMQAQQAAQQQVQRQSQDAQRQAQENQQRVAKQQQQVQAQQAVQQQAMRQAQEARDGQQRVAQQQQRQVQESQQQAARQQQEAQRQAHEAQQQSRHQVQLENRDAAQRGPRGDPQQVQPPHAPDATQRQFIRDRLRQQ